MEIGKNNRHLTWEPPVIYVGSVYIVNRLCFDKLTTFMCECLEILEPRSPGTIRARTGIAVPFCLKGRKELLYVQLHTFVASAGDAVQLYVTVAVFVSNNPGTPCRGGCVGTRGCLDAVEKIKKSLLSTRESVT